MESSVVSRIKSVFATSAINQTELQTLVGIPRSAITEWQKGKARPSLDAMIKIARYFHVSIDWLLFGDDCESYVRFPTSNGSWLSSNCTNMSFKKPEKELSPTDDNSYINLFNSLSVADKSRVVAYMDALSGNTYPSDLPAPSPKEYPFVMRI